MKLEQIEERLQLFPTYLKDIFHQDRRLLGFIEINARQRKKSPEEIIKLMEETGMMIIDNGNYYNPTYSHLSFDAWLFDNKHYDLVDYSVYPNDEGLIDWVKNNGVTSQYEGNKLSSYNMWEQEDRDICRNNDVTGLRRFFVPSWPMFDKWGYQNSYNNPKSLL